ncbi:hypothetical protein [Microvirga solisilvae]|uniref:hypothetical protein n=1 Tax=Microvirga solisilvae TaxID=2919498 RepID=UPI001FAFE0CD|nr:hypothetical protein [Microvirga solisilvae]
MTDLHSLKERIGQAEGPERFWLILREPRCVPELKGPFLVGTQAQTLREFMKARPQAFITVLWFDEYCGPMVEDGPAWLMVLDRRSRSTALKHIDSTRAALTQDHGDENV